jgi:hypothetical protein
MTQRQTITGLPVNFLLTNCPLAEMQKALRGVQGFMQEEEKKGGSSNGFGRGTIWAS